MVQTREWMLVVLALLGALLLWLLLGGCESVKEGPAVDLRDLAQPEKEPQPPLPKPSRPPQQAGKLRVWVPRQETPNGDIQEGYWLTLSAKPPQAETVEPPQPLPRLPHQYQSRRQQPQRQPATAQRQAPPGMQERRGTGAPGAAGPSPGGPQFLGVPEMEMPGPGHPTLPVGEVP